MEAPDTRSVAWKHSALCAMARRTRALLEGCACACGSKGCTDCLCESVDSLAKRLKGHFRAEEESWNGVDRARTARTTLSWIDRLVREHADLARRMDEACVGLAKARRARLPPPADLAAGIHALLDDLIDHELSETRLFQRSLFEDSSRFD